jgi:hypothetical protein
VTSWVPLKVLEGLAEFDIRDLVVKTAENRRNGGIESEIRNRKWPDGAIVWILRYTDEFNLMLLDYIYNTYRTTNEGDTFITQLVL